MLGTEIAAQSSPVPPSAAHRRHVVHRFLPPFTVLAATLILVASKLAYDHVERGASLLTAFTRRAPH